MFLWSILLLVPTILAAGTELLHQNYTVELTSHSLSRSTIEGIQVINGPLQELSLSDLNIVNITDNAFKNVSNIKVLDLSHNLLIVLRDTPFAILTKLEHLSLSHNKIVQMKKPFSHLTNLKVLDLSNNHIRRLNAGDFFGLTESCVILLKHNNISSMSTELFKNISTISISAGHFNQRQHIRQVSVPPNPSIKICITETRLISVEDYTEGENLTSDCSADRNHTHGSLSLNSLHITRFEEGWFKVKDSSIHHIDLSSNNITWMTSTILNDLPESIRSVDLAINRFSLLAEGIIENKYLQTISFQNNLIVKIEDDVFINTKLKTLNLSFNELKSTKFAATLPPTLTKIELIWNSITEISRDSFSNLNQLEVLQLDGNVIKKIGRDSLRGLSSLKNLTLETNGLKKIEAGSFKDLTNLEVLRMKSNFISKLEPGVFSGLNNIKYIFLGHNILSHLTRDSFIGLSDSLEVLDLQYNALENLKSGTFVNSPKYELLLNNNRIRNIEDGSFDLPNLQHLNLKHNLLRVIGSRTLQGFKRLCILDISGNFMERLENGTLHDLLQNEGCHVNLKRVPIETIHGGVFASSVNSSFSSFSEGSTPSNFGTNLL